MYLEEVCTSKCNEPLSLLGLHVRLADDIVVSSQPQGLLARS